MSTAQPHPAHAVNPPATSPGWAFKLWLGCSIVASLAGLVVVTLHPSDGLMETPPTVAAARADPKPPNAVTSNTAPDEPMPIDLHYFALNALLLPLLDEAEPPQWTDVAVDFMCDQGTSVLVNGEPMVPGKPIPATAFTVQWKMNRCTPMGPASIEVTGNVDLVVFHEDEGLSAIVMPDRLRVDSHMGRAWLHAPFSAEASLIVPAHKP